MPRRLHVPCGCPAPQNADAGGAARNPHALGRVFLPRGLWRDSILRKLACFRPEHYLACPSGRPFSRSTGGGFPLTRRRRPTTRGEVSQRAIRAKRY